MALASWKGTLIVSKNGLAGNFLERNVDSVKKMMQILCFCGMGTWVGGVMLRHKKPQRLKLHPLNKQPKTNHRNENARKIKD